MRIALLQIPPVANGSREALIELESAAKAAAAQGADILITPEMFLTGYNIGIDKIRLCAEPLTGGMMQDAGEIARQHGIALVTGFAERSGDAIFNTAVFIEPSGKPSAHYRKTHLYGDVDKTQFAPGDQLCRPFPYKGWTIALTICYDIEFPEVARHLAIGGADLILVPTANMKPYDSVATRLVPARAQENTVYVAYANYIGSEPPFDYCGQSCLCGPDGEDIARAGTEAAILYGDVSKQELASLRQTATHLADIQANLYQLRGKETSENEQ